MAFVSGNIIASQRDILGLPVCDLGWADTFAFVEEVATMPFGQSVIAFLTAQNGNRMMRDADYRAVLERQIVLPDGDGVDLASRLFHGRSFPANLSGTAFVPALLTYLTRPMRVALIGGEESMLIAAAEALRRHAPWHEILPIADGAFDPAQSDSVMERVRAAKVDILLVSMGSPAQEKWIDRHVGPGHARLVLSVGGLFEALVGETYRVPLGVRTRRFDGLRRFLFSEPGLANVRFLYHVLRHKLSGRRPLPVLAATAKAGAR